MVGRAFVSLAFSAGLIALTAPASGQESVYTQIGDCSARNAPNGFEFLISFVACEGYGEWTVYAGATEQTARLGFGERNLPRQLEETPITSVGAFSTTAQTLEWRTRGRTPFATIARWTARRGSARLEEYLVVTALDARNGACHVAYIDATRINEANAVARAAADQMAEGFRCGSRAPQRIDATQARRLRRGR